MNNLLWLLVLVRQGTSFVPSHRRAPLALWPYAAVEPGTLAPTSYAAPVAEIARRRNLAIIAHPDAGKTTLTEKLLLYGGALQQAGAVRHRASQRAATSDWMELERKRGISITSTVLSFDYLAHRIIILDTPGHADFSEDTYRTLAACDNAVCLVDAAKGLEPMTRKLLGVCRLARLPVFTFCNKLDRPSLEPLEIMEQIETEFGLSCHPVKGGPLSAASESLPCAHQPYPI